MWSKILIIAFLVVILYSLGSGLYYMVRDKGTTDRALHALMWRIGLSVALFILLVIGFYTGVIDPHGIAAR